MLNYFKFEISNFLRISKLSAGELPRPEGRGFGILFQDYKILNISTKT